MRGPHLEIGEVAVGNVISIGRPRRRRAARSKLPRSSWLVTLLIAVLAGLGYVSFSQDEAGGAAARPDAGTIVSGVSFAMCGRPPHANCVIDGDTFYLGDESIRVADIDTPEVSQPQCLYEGRLGRRATERFQQLLNAGPITLALWDERDVDQYGRKLRVVMRDGRSLGDTLVAEGLAHRWTGSRQPWCV
jgi:endonuclease YncB( thermonuclease family)